MMIRWVSAQAFQERLTPALWLKVTGTFVLVLLPPVYFLPAVFGILLLGGAAFKWVAVQLRRDDWGIAAALAVISAGVILLYNYWRHLGLSVTFITLLAVLGVAKLLESRNARDIRMLFLIEILLILAALTYSQTFGIFLYALLTLVLSLRTLLQAEQRHHARMQALRVRDVAKVFLFALPFTLTLFFFMPRIQPLWGVANPRPGAVTGLPDEMSVGDLSSLAQSNEIAFRVRFMQGRIPPGKDLYWRGPVLWHFDGKRWTQRRRDAAQPPAPVRYLPQSAVTYDWQAVKPEMKWLTPLDIPIKWPADVRVGAAWQMLKPLQAHPGDYHFVSATRYQSAQALSAQDKSDALQLPANLLMPQLRAFARKLYADNQHNPRAFAAAFLAHLSREEYYYSLGPPPGAGNPDIFFFRDRIGFCEHYASVMVLAARIVGIPARVVIGYQGGDFNPLNGDWIVREESAHAWTELWLDGTGWTRFDPTAAVSPNRILRGHLSADTLTAGSDDRAFTTRLAEKWQVIAGLRNAADATRAFWQNWVIHLDRSRQQGLFQRLGLGQYAGIVALLLLLVASILLGRLWANRRAVREDAVTRRLRKTLARLERKGHIKTSAESPAVFFRRIAPEMPAKQQRLLYRIADHYEALRYRESENDSQLLSLLKQLHL